MSLSIVVTVRTSDRLKSQDDDLLPPGPEA